MIPFSNYQLYQAERSLTEAEQRGTDRMAGELAAAMDELRSSFAGRAKALLGVLRSRPRRTFPAPAEN
ncbi:MAG TPA: hypothetical protein VMF65_15375 [Acidimicrobiales bacterium]|nr:hypothetical protein [Acidimicrobiales bacterium]